MKKIVFLGLCLTISCIINAQVKNPVKWVFTAKSLGSGRYEVRAIATIDRGWHIYSQTTPAGGPVATTIRFTKNPLITLEGPAKEAGKLEQHFEKLFGVDVKQYSNKVEFIQKVTVRGKAKTSLGGTIEFMVCNDKECLPPKQVPFNIPLR